MGQPHRPHCPPNHAAFVLIQCILVQVLEKGARFTMRDGSKTLGYGVVTQCNPDIDYEEYEKLRKKVKKAKKLEREQQLNN